MFDIIKNERNVPTVIDKCSCSSCGWSGLIMDCEAVVDQDGWEMPEYTYHVCPNCKSEDGIDSYWNSEDDCDVVDEWEIETR